MAQGNEIWNARRKKLEAEVSTAALDLFEHLGSAGAFMIPLDTNENLFVAAGPKADILTLTKT